MAYRRRARYIKSQKPPLGGIHDIKDGNGMVVGHTGQCPFCLVICEGYYDEDGYITVWKTNCKHNSGIYGGSRPGSFNFIFVGSIQL